MITTSLFLFLQKSGGGGGGRLKPPQPLPLRGPCPIADRCRTPRLQILCNGNFIISTELIMYRFPTVSLNLSKSHFCLEPPQGSVNKPSIRKSAIFRAGYTSEVNQKPHTLKLAKINKVLCNRKEKTHVRTKKCTHAKLIKYSLHSFFLDPAEVYDSSLNRDEKQQQVDNCF